jgi:Phage integrase family
MYGRFSTSRAAGIGEQRFHGLRHTFGTHMAASGQVSLRQLQEWFGHARISTTEIYADSMPGENEAALVDAAFARPTPGGRAGAGVAVPGDQSGTKVREAMGNSVELNLAPEPRRIVDGPISRVVVPAVAGSNPVAHPRGP